MRFMSRSSLRIRSMRNPTRRSFAWRGTGAAISIDWKRVRPGSTPCRRKRRAKLTRSMRTNGRERRQGKRNSVRRAGKSTRGFAFAQDSPQYLSKVGEMGIAEHGLVVTRSILDVHAVLGYDVPAQGRFGT